MQRLIISVSLWLIFSLHAHADADAEKYWKIVSPDEQVLLEVKLESDSLYYRLSFNDKPVLRWSKLGLALKNAPPLQANLQLESADVSITNQQWQPVWGEQAVITNHYKQLTLALAEKASPERRIGYVFRVFNDGLGLRYTLPETDNNPAQLTVTNELTEFAFDRNFSAWWIPAYRDQRYEYQYMNSALSSVDVAHTPLTLEDKQAGIAVAVHEAALVDYTSMTLRNQSDNQITFTADLVPWANGDKAYINLPFSSPWRTITVAEKAVELLNSSLLLNLNEPPAEQVDTSYIKPGKYMGIWWEMHIGEKDWSPGPKQGATTKRAMEYIDFASQHDIDGVLVEGWNTGWEGNWWERAPTFSFTDATAGFDIEKVSQYAIDKGLRLIGHHETAAGISYYEQQMEDGFSLYEALGVQSVKMGYVGTRVDGKEWHHGQFMVRHFARVVKTAAANQIMINAHETIKDTGLRRTYPNLMTRESVRGMEYNGGSPDTGNLPNHTVIIPFTRGLAGPIDFTPGIFNFDYQKYRPHNRVPTTLAKQLALYVTLYSPLQMAADLPENYAGHPAFAFIDAVPTDWQQSHALQGDIGEFLVTARQDKHSNNWYVGATTNEEPRTLSLALNFLDPHVTYKAIRYQDGPDAHWENNPEDYEIVEQQVNAGQSLTLNLKPGGGQAIEFIPVQ
ncbi:glycoside hydrolase family 97 protein [Alteromonas gilva]|uniref:Glycoside hydrolase family 97 protein n=1 Tax=Alteromonas gilva TaxID=2987522 RepID=A0ABT5KZV0_9ALTE|nr:glycoside hydrolase family 97 protein [Alteromonas gilva]MDC8830298.1 glycoside hydrolase family 97 protein [Alteromonas gilva]